MCAIVRCALTTLLNQGSSLKSSLLSKAFTVKMQMGELFFFCFLILS
jgi:hypothetical protein